ncbi:MAG TPA: hypothetical protein VIM02_01965 [Rhizomicrobium sp.]|jgi:tetratricopeptide (TPR) repeat protein
MRTIVLVLGFALALGCAASAEDPPASYDRGRVEALHNSLMAALKLIDAEPQDNAAIAAALKPILADPSFPYLAEDERHAAYRAEGSALVIVEDFAGGLPWLQKASQMPEADEDDWDFRLQAALALGDWDDAAGAATVLAQRWPDKLSEYNDSAIWRLARGLDTRPELEGVETELLKALHAIQWKPKDAFSTADSLWFSLVRLHLQRDELPGAIVVAGDISEPDYFLDMQSDKRFDAVIESDPGHFDVMAAYEARLAHERADAAAAPDKLEGINTVAGTLTTLGRDSEAMALIETALARNEADPKAFSDASDYLKWTLDIHSRLLFAAGRSEEAFQALADGAKQDEVGRANVSQKINLADEYVTFDRPKEALSAVENVEDAKPSAYGLMALADARARAYFELGDTANLEKTFAYMRANAHDGKHPYLTILLLTGRLDDAAAEIIAELQDPASRTDALRRVQDYLPDEHLTPREQALHAAWLAVRNRADVQAEIAKFGHVHSYALHGSPY